VAESFSERDRQPGGVVSVFQNDVASWEALAKTDPLWAVLSSDEFHGDALTPEAEDRFWRSGEEHVAHVIAVIRNEIDPGFSPGVALDFGCGVGRNLVPLAQRCRHAIGLDASPTMVARTAERLAAVGVDNASAIVIDRTIDPTAVSAHGPVDFVHSVLVFQHIVASEGFALFDQLLGVLDPGGFGFVQFHGHNPGGEVERLVRAGRLRYGWFNSLALKSRIPLFSDLVMLYEYDMVELLRHLSSHRIADLVVERTDAGPGGYDVRLYFAKYGGTEAEFEAAGRSMCVRVRP
jgi:SAM-dependent methyltransferase